ncbi:MAG: hypothetical protein K0U37_00945 [Gammaproteobacteria bacterium]|nr:hypothetical protein [Gammaproteobacteria bacterium]
MSKLSRSESLHNKNCYAYLNHLNLPGNIEGFPEKLSLVLNKIRDIKHANAYTPTQPYADTYHQFFTVLEDELEKLTTEQISRLDALILSVYGNDNKSLENMQEAIRDASYRDIAAPEQIESDVGRSLKDKTDKRRVNKATSPLQAGSMLGRAKATFGFTFKPQHTTSIATIRHYRYPQTVLEYRFGTQAQRHKGFSRVSPLFKRFLEVQKKYHPETKITHIYFNNLGRDRSDIEGSIEAGYTNALETLEGLDPPHTNIAVITIPSDQGLMDKHELEKTKAEYTYAETRTEFLNIALENNQATTPIRDFHISRHIRDLLFSVNPEQEKRILEERIDNSFKAVGIKPDAPLSPAERQAVYFHFNKFELPNYIIKTLKPEGINFSCKDAIDRGGVSSAYYNLLKSFETDIPMNRDEFERALHAAPAMVKGRGMNHHIHLIWNTIDAYVNQHLTELKRTPDKAWLIEWRDANYPEVRINHLLTQDIEKGLVKLCTAQSKYLNNPEKLDAIQEGIHILENIQSYGLLSINEKYLLLKTAQLTPDIILEPTPEKINQYDTLQKDMVIKYPSLQILTGYMKILLGKCLSLFGKKKILEAGRKDVQSGIHASDIESITEQMKEKLHLLESVQPSEDEQEKPPSIESF